MSKRPERRKLVVLGCTGSIGVNTLRVVEHLNRDNDVDIKVVGLAAGTNVSLLIEQARRFSVRQVAIADATLQDSLREALPDAAVFAGPHAARKLIEESDATDAVAAIVGAAGLEATLAAIDAGMRIALANKETLVGAGALVVPRVHQKGARLIPVDSEHSAIFQCLEAQTHLDQQSPGTPHVTADTIDAPNFHHVSTRYVKRIVLTASGGPFRCADRQTIVNATPEEALDHPTWDMGPKITIDSASMMNKALEVIEAHWLFGLPASRIDMIVHPQSLIHSFVEFRDHSILAQVGPPDMRTPIQYALTYPDRPAGCGKSLDWSTLSQLTFELPDFGRFPLLRLAYDVVAAGATAGAIFNAANEASVKAFLDRRIRFGRIFELVAAALESIAIEPVDCLQAVLDADRQARSFVDHQIAVGQT